MDETSLLTRELLKLEKNQSTKVSVCASTCLDCLSLCYYRYYLLETC